MMALFVWPAPPPKPEHHTISARDVLGMFDRAAEALYPNGAIDATPTEVRRAEHEVLGVVLDQLDARWPPPAPPPPLQPDIPIEGEVVGLRWGRVEVPAATEEVAFARFFFDSLRERRHAPAPIIFRRCGFRYVEARLDAFVAEGVSIAHVVDALPHILRLTRADIAHRAT